MKFKTTIQIFILSLLSIQTSAQAWVSAGDDFIGNTDFFNTMTSVCINDDGKWWTR